MGESKERMMEEEKDFLRFLSERNKILNDFSEKSVHRQVLLFQRRVLLFFREISFSFFLNTKIRLL